jgi:hypothetical protein
MTRYAHGVARRAGASLLLVALLLTGMVWPPGSASCGCNGVNECCRVRACHETDGASGWDRCAPDQGRTAVNAPATFAALLPDRPALSAPHFAARAPAGVESLSAARWSRPPDPPPRPFA